LNSLSLSSGESVAKSVEKKLADALPNLVYLSVQPLQCLGILLVVGRVGNSAALLLLAFHSIAAWEGVMSVRWFLG
jgi:hypothetical protein